MRKLKKGDRVRFSAKAIEREIPPYNCKIFTGTVVSLGRNGTRLTVHRDGRKSASAYHIDFWELIKEKPVQEAAVSDQCCGNCVHLICENRSGIGLCDMPLPIWADWKDQEPVTMSVDNGKLCPCHVRREKEKERP